MSQSTPFSLLQELDRRCRNGARGLPTGARVEDDWIGVGFKLHDETLVARMSDIAEIINPPQTIRVPGVRQWVRGLANIRGTLLPILDMCSFLGGGPSDTSVANRVLVINKNNIVAGLLVQEVFGIRRFKPAHKREAAACQREALQPYLEGVFSDGSTQWNVFSVDKLVNHDAFMKVI